ncbi:phenylacetate-CoA oxygenase subunit PaaJ [Catellatospora sp. TT07R-123]|uniref:1,2-phenylacetyl-CoA epoxidase subunit PaaD n=1 Tax=Catellatospora sp. TT07R-123 TaxID=2733863 RepID=UPI001B15BBFB|nr:1,2-phenylacetyl-CoA epoxidase subunit PaaD [Catellatospora sp. TT07R-123]GHJ50563.1 phenylacetate-CoA oxygenase subunit PaaJ [Catellatospora sp. TT07R-123]
MNTTALRDPLELAGAVPDPELRVITIAELGILRGVETGADGRVTAVITPTYSGCPAMDAIADDVRAALAAGGYPDARVRTVLSPAWSTDMITESGWAALRRTGIAAPGEGGTPSCPHCAGGSAGADGPVVVQLSRYASTPCQSLWRCHGCLEPFNAIKKL